MAQMFNTRPISIRDAVLQAKLATDYSAEKITVKNLSLQVWAGVDAWKRPKSQPALLTISLHLAQRFDCRDDKLDNTTVHYGLLSKTIKQRFENSEMYNTMHQLAREVGECALEVASPTKVKAVEVEVFFPKASLLGDGVAYKLSLYKDADRDLYESHVLQLRNLRIPCIVGLNDNEREAKQPIIINVWKEDISSMIGDHYTDLEEQVTKMIWDSNYGTLEAMATEMASMLLENMVVDSKDSKPEEHTCIRLRIEKPIAVPFADAPAVEILRPYRRTA